MHTKASSSSSGSTVARALLVAFCIITTTILIAYGLFATLYWPVTVLSTDVWGAGYANLPPENVTATNVATILWVIFTLAAAFMTLMIDRKIRNWHLLARWANFLGWFGLAAVLLVVPHTFAGVAVYNVVPYTTPWPDQITPAVLLAGFILLGAAVVLGILAWRTRAKRVSTGRDDLQNA